MTSVYQWAKRWNVPVTAIHELLQSMGTGFDSPQVAAPGLSEAAVQSAIRVEAAHKGVMLFRNNVGVLQDVAGRPVRYGLCNDTPALNKKIKSGDLIGLRRLLITPAHVGTIVGQFVSREVKAAGWRYTGTGHEAAQAKWIEIVMSHGGDASFASGPGSL
jgi:hypothetical protein